MGNVHPLQAEFDRAYSANDGSTMAAIAKTDEFRAVLATSAQMRGEAMIREGGDQTKHVARLFLAICMEAEVRETITKIQRAQRKTLEARVDKLTQQLSALQKELGALARREGGR